MQRSLLVVSIFVLAMFSAPLVAQLSDVSSNPGFSGQSVKFDFNGMVENTDVSTVFAEWGLTFPGGDSGTARIRSFFAAGSVNSIVRNVPASGTSANKPMILNFRYPVSRVGMVLSGGSGSTQVTIEAFGPLGPLLGTVQRSGLADPTQVAVATTHVGGISILVISFGNDSAQEEIDELQFQFLQRPQFVSYLSQIGNGSIGTDSLQTTIVVSNLSNSTAVGEVEFFDSSGGVLNLQIGEQVASSFPLAIRPYSSLSGTTGGAALAIGYARITSNVPIEATAIFRIVTQAGAVRTEAGVGGTKGSSVAVGAVQKALLGTFDSGIAAVNTSNQAASARLELVDQRGVVIGSNEGLVSLGPGAHTAKFLSEIFPVVAERDFDGTIRLASDVPIALVILRTGNGLVLSSLPVGTTQK